LTAGPSESKLLKVDLEFAALAEPANGHAVAQRKAIRLRLFEHDVKLDLFGQRLGGEADREQGAAMVEGGKGAVAEA
jgi:hypothetical protein